MSLFNVLQILPSLDSGGVERGTIDLANYLSSNKIFNHIISNGGRMEIELNTEYSQHYNLSVNSKNLFLYPYLAKKIDKYIKNHNINLIHVRSRGPSWILKFVQKKGLKTVSTFHNVYGGSSYLKKIYNKELANVDYVIAISHYVKNSIVKKYNINPNKITVINRGIDTVFFDDDLKENDKNIFINKYKIKKNKKIILYPARLTEWKGQKEFLSVIKKIVNENYFTYFVGDDKNFSYTSVLQNEINKSSLGDKCMILGNLNRNELKLMYSISDIVISAPLRPEGFGRIVSEGMSMKKIVLAFDFGGVSDQLKQIDSLYKIQPRNYEALSNKINLLSDLSDEKKINLTNIARNHVLKYFTSNEMVNKYKNFYDNIFL
tara:strand:+ start:23232 stop:24359 length:1128 start_codon:yes stop_codon:yes gene_type:complete